MDKKLQQLIQEVKRYDAQTEDYQQALVQLVETIMSGNTICRPCKGQPLSGIYQEIYEEVRQQLLSEVEQQINQYNLQQLDVREWVRNLRHQAFREVLDNTRLKELALEAQRQPSAEPGEPIPESRRYALGELVEAIRLSGKLAHPHRGKFRPEFYHLLYDEARNRTLYYVWQKIDNYDPNKGDGKFMNWVNNRLSYLILDTHEEFRWIERDNKWLDKNNQKTPSLVELERIAEEQARQGTEQGLSLLEIVRNYILEDPGKLFKKEHIRDNPAANFQAIALETLSGKTWKEISETFKISGESTCNRFFHRCCKKFAEKIKDDLGL